MSPPILRRSLVLLLVALFIPMFEGLGAFFPTGVSADGSTVVGNNPGPAL